MFAFWYGKLYATPLQGDAVLNINPQTDEITRIELTPKFSLFERKSEYYKSWMKDMALPYLEFNQKRMTYMVQLPYDYSMADIDLSSGEISNRRKWYIRNADKMFWQLREDTKYPLYEGKFMLLGHFLDKPCTEYIERDLSANTAGRGIYEYIKNLSY